MDWHKEDRKWVPLLGPKAPQARNLVIPSVHKRPPESPGDNAAKNASGIDMVAWVCRHELQHVNFCQQGAWWAKGYLADDDKDDDLVPDTIEPTFMLTFDAKYKYDPENPTTFADDWNYTRPGAEFIDNEDCTLIAQPRWVNGSADEQDWSKGGKQWQK